MKSAIKLAGGLALSCLLTACVNNHQLYSWGSYEGNLYGYYKKPATQDQVIEGLAADIKDAEESHTVPPGLYAEYGFFLLQSGKKTDAVAMFTKEKSKWPESATFMDVLIKDAAADTLPKQAAADTKAGAIPAATPTTSAGQEHK